MRVVLSSLGSRGDVHPIIAVAAGLHARGHDLTVCVPKLFAPEVTGRGMRAVTYSEDSDELMQGFGRGWTGLRRALQWFSRTIDEQIEILLGETADADVLLTTTNEIAAPTVAEHRGIPFVRLTYGPMTTGYRDNPLIPWQGLPPIANRLGWTLINASVDLMAHRPIQRHRRRLGLPAITRVGDYLPRYGHTLFAMSPVLAPPCPSWQGRYRYQYCGHCAEQRDETLSESLRDFIAAGPPPIYLGLGSVHVDQPKRFTRMVREAVLRAGCRAIVGAGWAGLGEGAESSRLLVVGETDHAQLFPLLGGVVHHGGAGTTHTAAEAGVPQLVLPQFADQFYWGHRVHRLGLGPAALPERKLDVPNLAQALRSLTHNRIYTEVAAQVGRTLCREQGVEEAVAAIELEASASLVEAGTDLAKVRDDLDGVDRLPGQYAIGAMEVD